MFTHHASVDTKLSRAVEHLLDSATEDGILPIVQAGEPVLRQRTVAYDGQLTRATLTKLISLMHSTMLEAPGVGLAAPQIGLGLAIAKHVALTHHGSITLWSRPGQGTTVNFAIPLSRSDAK